jgi:hypothetical protein
VILVLVLLLLALILGGAGFALHTLWISAIVVAVACAGAYVLDRSRR